MSMLTGFVDCPYTKRLRELMDCYCCDKSYQILNDRVECADFDNPFKSNFVDVIQGDNIE